MEINIDIENKEEAVIFRIDENEVNHGNAASLKEKLFLEIADGNVRIILDLGKVKEMDSSGLGALLFGKRQATNAGGNMLLVSVQPAVSSMLRIAQLSRVFDMFESADQALASFSK
jgi:anti-sigma B factor antagonist